MTGTQEGAVFCGSGTGFSLGSRVNISYLNLPGISGPAVGPSLTTDFNGTFSFTDKNFARHGITCTAADLQNQALVQATDVETGGVTTAPFDAQFFCLNATTPADFNGGCH